MTKLGNGKERKKRTKNCKISKNGSDDRVEPGIIITTLAMVVLA